MPINDRSILFATSHHPSQDLILPNRIRPIRIFSMPNADFEIWQTNKGGIPKNRWPWARGARYYLVSEQIFNFYKIM